jgi:hypothetical protein
MGKGREQRRLEGRWEIRIEIEGEKRRRNKGLPY